MAEQRPRLVDTSFRHQPADTRARDDELLVAYRVNLLDTEAVLIAENPEQREVAAAIAAEEEIGAHPDLGDAQPVDQNAPHERLGPPARQLMCKADDRRALDAGALQRFELLRLRHQQRRRFVGTDDAGGMRIKGQDERGPAPLRGDATDALDDLDVPAMQAI